MTDLTAPKPGDLFYFPAVNANDEPGFVIARYIELIPPVLGHLIEVFAHFCTKIPASIEDSRHVAPIIQADILQPALVGHSKLEDTFQWSGV